MTGRRPRQVVRAAGVGAPGPASASLLGAQAGDGAAVLAAPGLPAFPDRDRGDGQGGSRVQPPPPQQAVGEQAGQNRGCEVCAEQVLRPFAGGGAGPQASPEPLLGHAQRRHQEQAADGERDPHRGRLRPMLGEQVPDGLDGDIGREQPEADRDRLLRPLLRSI